MSGIAILKHLTFAIGGLALTSGLAISTACSSRDDRKLLPVSLPDLSRVDPAVQSQARERYASLTQKIENARTPVDELGTAYGELGMVLQAADYLDAAEPYYLNAQTLVSGEMRWPYYLASLHRRRGETARAEAAFKRVLALRPDDVATLVWLGRLYLDEGRWNDAEPLFMKALGLAPRSVAVLAGLGRVALAKRDYAGAVQVLEQALSIDPEAESLHAPLAMAYRGLGDLHKAEPHLRQWRNSDIFVPDPLQEELDLLLESGPSYELRGVRALEVQDWTGAASFFRKGLELTKGNTPFRRTLQHKLGTALYMSGDARGATEQFEAVARASPASGFDESGAKAHYSLGVLMTSSGRDAEAIEHLSAAVRYQPTYVEAQIALADVLRRSGQLKASLAHYDEGMKINPRSAVARLGYAMALGGLRRDREARDWLSEAVRLLPDQPQLAHALARLMATSPDDRVRDGQRAMAIVQELIKRQKSIDLGETMAMALAELGAYKQAAVMQRDVMAAARQAGLNNAVQRMADNLRLYERGQPCRTPWRNDEPVQTPEPTAPPDPAVPSGSR